MQSTNAAIARRIVEHAAIPAAVFHREVLGDADSLGMSGNTKSQCWAAHKAAHDSSAASRAVTVPYNTSGRSRNHKLESPKPIVTQHSSYKWCNKARIELACMTPCARIIRCSSSLHSLTILSLLCAELGVGSKFHWIDRHWGHAAGRAPTGSGAWHICNWVDKQ